MKSGLKKLKIIQEQKSKCPYWGVHFLANMSNEGTENSQNS